MKQQRRQQQLKRQRRQAKSRQRRQAKSRQRTATRPVRTLDDNSPEAAWLRVPASKGGPGGGVQGILNHARVLMYTGRLEEADDLMQQAKQKAPLHPEIRAYRAAIRALAGDFSGAIWPDMRRVYQGQANKYPIPLWDGTPQPDKRLLLWDSLSGYGDAFQTCRLVAPAKAQFQGQVVYGVMAGLSRLLQSLRGPDALIEPPFSAVGFDYHAPLDWLPAVDGCALTSELLGASPYVHADAALVERWRPTFSDQALIHVGLHWRADQAHFSGTYRAVALRELEPLFGVRGVKFYSLQYDGQAEVAAYPAITDLGGIDDRAERFVQTAAVMTCLDLMIAVDSGPAHLAGSLGLPTYLLLDLSNDPRWRLEGSSTPFYPQHRLYRSHQLRDFSGVVWDARDALEQLVYDREKHRWDAAHAARST